MQEIDNMVAYFPAPALCQGADEDLLIEMGATIFPDFIQRVPGANGLRLRLQGNYRDDSLMKTAADQFQTLLGILRAWRSVAGQRVDEVRPGTGTGSIRDEHGNQLVTVGSAIMYVLGGSEVEAYVRDVKVALQSSPDLRNALWLHGRRDRNSADFYMIYEYAEEDLGGRKAIIETLGVTGNDITRLRTSANNLAPSDGGRHAKGTGTAEWSLDDQREFIASFLKRWATHRAHATA
jgi:hypothetical protein